MHRTYGIRVRRDSAASERSSGAILGDSRQSLQQKLDQTEQALERCEKIALATRYAGAIMHEVNNPLEAITNLVYLTKIQKDNPEQVIGNMEIVEKQLQTLGRVTKQALTFHRQETETTEWDDRPRYF